MRGVSTDIGTIHFVGIGGIGMSGIASIMHNMGYHIRGSDLVAGATVDRLRSSGIAIAIGHAPHNIAGAAVVVISSAVERGNVEVETALAQRIPVVRRGEMLAELMRLKSTVAVAGTHGKTTTTSMIAALLDAGGFDPTVINGGVINSYGSNAHLGAGDWMVVESDESDGSFLRLDGVLAVVTNIDTDHLDHWGTLDALKDAFVAFVENVPFYGAAIVCVDDPQVQAILPRISDRRIIGYGFSAQADVRAHGVQPEADGVRFDVTIRDRDGKNRDLAGLRLPMPGRYNVQNALAALAVARHLHIDDIAIKRGFAGFSGVKRRFTLAGTVACAGTGTAMAGTAQIIDDYAHHPTEIAALLSAARESMLGESAGGRIIAVIQPHRFTRLAAMMADFATALHEADILLVLPVYTAGEVSIVGATSLELVQLAQARGHRAAHLLVDTTALVAWLAKEIAAGDRVVCMGAGDITKIATGLAPAIASAISAVR